MATTQAPTAVLATPPPSKLDDTLTATPIMADSGTPGQGDGVPPAVEHLNIKVTDNNNEVFFKIKRTTPLKKLMDAFCERQGKQPSTVRFLFDGTRVRPDDSPESVRIVLTSYLAGDHATSVWTFQLETLTLFGIPQLDMADGDTLEVHQEQIGG